MPTYNGEKYLQEQIQSILNQSFSDFSLHIFDDRSTDQTAQTVFFLAKKDKRIHFHQNPSRKGIINNINDALAIVDSDIYFLADQDDVWLPEKMSKQIEVMQPDDVVMSFSNLSLMDDNGHQMGIDYWSSQEINPAEANRSEIIAIKTMVTGCTMAFKKKLLEIALPIPEQATMHDHWLSFFATKTGQVVPVTEELVLYRQHAGNVIGAMITPHLRRERRYAGCRTYQDFKSRKQADFRKLLISLDAFAERLELHKLDDLVIKKYVTYYTAILNRKWLRSFRVSLQLKSLPNQNTFFRTLIVFAFFPMFYLLLKIRSAPENIVHNSDSL